jgi:hypothetical protein
MSKARPFSEQGIETEGKTDIEFKVTIEAVFQIE